jgi:hypothetical protein
MNLTQEIGEAGIHILIYLFLDPENCILASIGTFWPDLTETIVFTATALECPLSPIVT